MQSAGAPAGPFGQAAQNADEGPPGGWRGGRLAAVGCGGRGGGVVFAAGSDETADEQHGYEQALPGRITHGWVVF